MRTVFFAFLAAAFVVATAAPGFAQTVTVNPKRLVFEGRKRADQAVLINEGDKKVTYRVFFQEIQKETDGSSNHLKTVPPGYRKASDKVLFSPRQVEIPPKGNQVIRFFLRKPKDLAEGEYRSYVTFQAVPDENGQTLDDVVLKQGEVSVRLTPVFGLAIPVIIRQGDVRASTSLSNLSVGKAGGEYKARFKVNREGNGSAFGNFKALYTPPGGGDATTVGEANGVAVYPEQPYLTFGLKLAPPKGVTLARGGTIQTLYQDEKGKILAQARTEVR
ncbi:MAG: hypothetical protein ABW189_04570 [Rickettsiales bacterium]